MGKKETDERGRRRREKQAGRQEEREQKDTCERVSKHVLTRRLHLNTIYIYCSTKAYKMRHICQQASYWSVRVLSPIWSSLAIAYVLTLLDGGRVRLLPASQLSALSFIITQASSLMMAGARLSSGNRYSR